MAAELLVQLTEKRSSLVVHCSSSSNKQRNSFKKGAAAATTAADKRETYAVKTKKIVVLIKGNTQKHKTNIKNGFYYTV